MILFGVECFGQWMFEIVILVVFQSVFCFEMYKNNFFKKIFLILIHQNNMKTSKNINLKQIKK